MSSTTTNQKELQDLQSYMQPIKGTAGARAVSKHQIAKKSKQMWQWSTATLSLLTC
jgi:hypothetical protein